MNDQGMLEPGKGSLRKSEASAGMDEGLRVLSYLISGVLVYGLLGWLGDHYLGTRFLLPIGIVAGAAFGVYVIIKRFGQIPDASAAVADKNAAHANLPSKNLPSTRTAPAAGSAPDTTEGAP